MLPEIAAEALQFLTRGEMDKASGVSKWLDMLTARSCGVYPLRRVHKVQLYAGLLDNTFVVRIEKSDVHGERSIFNIFRSLDEAVHFSGSLLRHSYVENLELRYISISPDQWTTLIGALCSAAVRNLEFIDVDFTALSQDAVLVVVGCRDLQSLNVQLSILPSDFVVDNLIRSSDANDLLYLCYRGNKSDTPQRLSDDAILDFLFPSVVAPDRAERRLELDGSGVTDMLFAKCLERLRSGTVIEHGRLKFYGTTVTQRGFAAFDPYLLPGAVDDARHAYYRIPSVGDDNKFLQVERCEYNSKASIEFYLLPLSA